MTSVWSTLEKEAEEEEADFQEARNVRGSDSETEKPDTDGKSDEEEQKNTETTDVGGDVPGGTESDDKTVDSVGGDEPASDKKVTEDTGVDPLAHWGFKEDDVEEWNKLPNENREFLIARDKKFQATAERREQNVAGMLRAIEPMKDEMVRHGISEADAIRRLVGVHVNLMDEKTRPQQVRDLLTMYGINPENIMEEAPEKDAIVERVEGVEKRLDDQRAGEIDRARSAMEAEVRAFRESGEAPHWEEVLPQMRYLFSTYVDNRQEAPGPRELYTKACKLNETVVAKVAASNATEEAGRAEAAKIAAGVKPKGETTSTSRARRPRPTPSPRSSPGPGACGIGASSTTTPTSRTSPIPWRGFAWRPSKAAP